MRTIPMVSIVATLLLSAGCASTGGSPATQQSARQHSQVDFEQIAQVEQVARRRGVMVQWVNLPQTLPDHDDR